MKKLKMNIKFTAVDVRRFMVRQFAPALFVVFFLRYLVSDNPPDREFPVSFRPETCDNCFQSDFERIIQPPEHTCGGKGDSAKKVDLVVLITTVPSAVDARKAVRGTWGSKKRSKSVVFLFLFGGGYSPSDQRLIEDESAIYGDVLQEDFKDNYYNLSLKVIMGYKWVMKSCPQAAFVARSAEDNFVNVPALLDLMRTRGGADDLQNLMVGDCENYALPWRWPFHKWAISVREYYSILFPPYCIGTTFVTSYKMMANIVDISPHVPFFPIEDVYFGMVIKQLGAKYGVRTLSGFNLKPARDSAGLDGRCPYSDPMLTVHPLKPEQIRRTWTLCPFSSEKT